MKALVKAQAAPGLSLQDVPQPKIGINDVLIRIDRTGICGTDMHIYNWDAWAQKTVPVPMAVGHEYSGEIVELGSEVRGFHTGDRGIPVHRPVMIGAEDVHRLGWVVQPAPGRFRDLGRDQRLGEGDHATL